LPERNELLMQLSADITGREFDVAASNQAPALGSAMYGAVAAGASAGGYGSIADAAAAMVRPSVRTYRPDKSTRGVYDDLYKDYLTLHDHFGRGGNDVMRRLRALRARQTRETAAPLG